MFESEAVLSVRGLLETGGDVLFLIGVVTLVMWTLMLERFWYFWRLHPPVASQVIEEWNSRADRTSWHAHQIRRLLISQVKIRLGSGLIMIQTLVAVCPLLGLLGTVTGMIEVFDVMAVAGSGNARAMASGVSRATIPTMAGMVAALSGLILSAQIDKYVEGESQRVADSMVLEHSR
jgi:biopolymer transport protein ExbB